MRSCCIAFALFLLILPMSDANRQPVAQGPLAANWNTAAKRAPTIEATPLVAVDTPGSHVGKVAGTDPEPSELPNQAVRDTEMSGGSSESWVVFQLDPRGPIGSEEEPSRAGPHGAEATSDTTSGDFGRRSQDSAESVTSNEEPNTWTFGALFVCALALLAAVIVNRRGVASRARSNQTKPMQRYARDDKAASSEIPSERPSGGH